MESLWKKQTPNIEPQKGKENTPSKDTHWDVIVVGAGLAGILIAYYLKESGKKVLVLEAAKIAFGQTEGTTAKITSQHDLKYAKMIEEIGVEAARMYAQANESAIREYERLIREKNIRCDFVKCPAYLYTSQDEVVLMEEAMAAASFGIDAFFTKETELPFPITGAVCFKKQARFSPLKFIEAIAKELEIWEQTKVTAIKGNKVITIGGILSADNIVMATHYPIKNLPGFYFLRQHQERSYVLALSGYKEIEGMYLGVEKEGLSLRQAGEYLLLGGGGRRTGEQLCEGKKGNAEKEKKAANDKPMDKVQQLSGFAFLEEKAKQYFPECNIEARWSAQDCMPHDGIPFIGKYSIFTPHLYVATGFGKWGMTSSMVAAMILRDEICGIENRFAEVFSPQRLHYKAGMKNLLTDIGVSAKGLVDGWILKRTHRCSHMGCGLKWNPKENVWECPCHGSRFDENGKILDNPTQSTITVRKK